ncbi:MAG TPA: hypothetical protein VKQ73_09115 [Stellaceae bacterium]|nr:hypothetical protein [Stellaceae bacterium]
MKHLLLGVAAAMTIGVITPVWAQWPATYPDPYRYRLVAPTPEDAYRDGLINRWELEQIQGPTPQALQGPSPNGDKGEGFK